VDTQLAGELTAEDGRRALVLSGSRQIEPGARAMLLLAEDLFRIDIVVSPDTIRTVIRNLSPGKLEVERGSGYGLRSAVHSVEAAAYRPGSTELRFTLGRGEDRVSVDVKVGLLRFADRGVVQVTGQAIVRQAPAG
jgi:hypothetical protein